MITRSRSHMCAALFVGSMLTVAFASPARAGISGVNTPVTSGGSVVFDDTFSFDPFFTPGITTTGPTASPWNGAPLVLPLTTDPNTNDFAIGTLDATFVVNTNTYAVNFTNITLDQAVGNTGAANLIFSFNIEFQLDALGLPQQAPIYPNFVVNGTVQSTSSSFAAVTGFIDYYGVNTAGTYSVLETVNYNSVWNTPGPFAGTAVGIPVNGFTPALVGFTTLTLDGVIVFTVDPATINAFSVQVVPEPTGLVALCGGLFMLAGATRRRAGRR